MIRILNGYRYDTDKATAIAENSSGGSVTDFRYWVETLYRTPRGRWFVAGEGGAMTRWCERIGTDGTRGAGSGIEPLTDEQAMQWLEQAGEIDALAEYFGDQIEDA